MNNGDNYKDLTAKRDEGTVVSEQKGWQKEDTRPTITGRPNIDEISKRNEEAVRQERRSSYMVAGIIVLLIMTVMLLVYFLS